MNKQTLPCPENIQGCSTELHQVVIMTDSQDGLKYIQDLPFRGSPASSEATMPAIRHAVPSADRLICRTVPPSRFIET